jgi:hypothetical protein
MTEQLRIGTAVPRIQYLADGTQTVFTYPFPIQAADDLQVWLGGTMATGGVSVSGAGVSAGGAVTFATPPAAGTIVTLRRWLSIRRTTDFQDDGIIRARTLNDELDTQTMVAQQLAEEIGRAPRRSPFSVSSADLTLPEPAAGRALKWNESGTGLDNSVSDPDALGGAATQAQGAAAQAMTAAAQAMASAAQAQAASAGLLTFTRIARWRGRPMWWPISWATP